MQYCSKNTLFRAYCMPMHACQLWIGYMYITAGIKWLRTAYHNACLILNCIPKNVSDHSINLPISWRYLMPLLQTNCGAFFSEVHHHHLHAHFSSEEGSRDSSPWRTRNISRSMKCILISILYPLISNVWCFLQVFSFFHYVMLLYDDQQMQ